MSTVPFSRRRSRSEEQALPHNLEAERAVLGAILLDNKQLPAVAGILSPDDFFLLPHRSIFRAMLRLIDAEQQATAITVAEAVQDSDPSIKGENIVPFVASLLDGAYPAAAASHAEIVRQKSGRRHQIYAAQDLAEAAADPSTDVAQSLEQAEQKLAFLRARAAAPGKKNGHPSRELLEFLGAEFQAPEHLVEGIIPRGGTVLIYALPHSLKSWFAAAIAIAATTPGKALGALTVNKPVRTILGQVEDPPAIFQWRIRQLLKSGSFSNSDPANLRIIDTSTFRAGDPSWFDSLRQDIEKFRADLLILDVLRRIIYPRDVNSPKETAEFLELLEQVRAGTNCAIALVHHANKKELMSLLTGAAGSYNLMGWANVVIGFKQKAEEGSVSHVTIEVDNKFSASPEPMRMTLDLGSSEPVRIVPGSDEIPIAELRERLGDTWTVRDLIEAAEMSRASAYRWIRRHRDLIEKVGGTGKGGPGRPGLARYRFLQLVLPQTDT